MNPKDRVDFLKRPRLDIVGRHKKKRIKIAGRWAAAQDQEAIEPLMTVARDRQDDYDVRLAAVQALGAVGAGQAVSTLAAILTGRDESGLHSAALTALERIGDDQAVGALIGAWEQVKTSQQNAIQQALIRLGTERTVEPLVATLGHSSPVVRYHTAATLRQFEGITPRLVAALGHEDAHVRDEIESLYIVKSVTPQDQVDYGGELTYFVVISAMLEIQAGLYDPLEGTTFVHFVQQPGNVIYNNVITGTLTVPSGSQTTVSFIVQVVTPTVAGVTVDATNKACVYPTGGTIAGDCAWFNEVTSEAFRPYGVYLPVVLRSHVAP